MTPINKSQVSAIYALLHKHGLTNDKADIVLEISAGRTNHVSELCFEEAAQWIGAMNKITPEESKEEAGKKRMIRHIFAMAHEMGWIEERATPTQCGSDIVRYKDYSRVHDWVKKYGYLKKAINEYTYKELPKLVTAFKNVYNGYLSNKSKPQL